jgi:hypothetical protein
MVKDVPISIFPKIYKFNAVDEEILKKNKNKSIQNNLVYHYNELDYINK